MKLLLKPFLFLFIISYSVSDNSCDVSVCGAKSSNRFLKTRYIFYDVNPPEGFNLRRDVYLRMAIFIRNLKKYNWLLVLPPWTHSFHWSYDNIPNQSRLPWSLFFNISKMSSFAPVIEMSEFLQTGKRLIDQVYVLQHFADTFTLGNFEDRMKVEPCLNDIPYESTQVGYVSNFWNYGNLSAKHVECLSFSGPASQLENLIYNIEAETIMFDHAEIVLHDRFGDKIYWDARKSMKFADHLKVEADNFREKYLNSTDILDGTLWENRKRTAVGGNYVCVHLRRRDFAIGRSKTVPSLKEASRQIKNALEELNLDTVFIATDAPHNEKVKLKKYLDNYQVFMYNPEKGIKSKYKDGGVAIIEQIICSHARKFYGTHESTFSFRIQEEREILGFKPETTFNRLCGDNETKCKPPSKWLIVH